MENDDGSTVTPTPTYNANGELTFSSTPVFTPGSSGPIVLSQTVTLIPTVTNYKMSFWVSAEEISTNSGFLSHGILGFRMTNVLPGNPIQWLAAPNGMASYGGSLLYEYLFTPLTGGTVDIDFISYGRFQFSPVNNTSPAPVIDDVIINAVPEPSTISLIAIGMIGVVRTNQRAGRRGKSGMV